MERERVVDQSALAGALRDYIAARPRPATRGSYRNALNRFARWWGKADRVEAMLDLLSLNSRAGNELVRQYRSHLEGARLSRNTVGFLVAPVQGFTRYAKEQGLVQWAVTFSQQGKPRKVLSKVVEDVPDVSRWSAGSLEAKVHETVNRLAVGKKRNTWRSYSCTFMDWAQFLGKPTVDEGLTELVKATKGNAHALMLDYQASLERRNMKSSSVAARTSAMKSFARLAKELDVITWDLAGVKAPRVQTYADTRGPQVSRIAEVAAMLSAKDEPGSTRDLALISLLYCHGLRITEVLGLDLEHIDLAGSRAFILEKGASDRRWLGLSAEACNRIKAWLRHRGPAPGPLFTGVRAGGRLTRENGWRITMGYGLGRPHGLRHAGITRVLDLSNGDVRRADLHGQAAAELAADLLAFEDEPKDSKRKKA